MWRSRKSTKTDGTGYGGDSRRDKHERNAGKKRALQAEKKRLIELEGRLKDNHDRLASKRQIVSCDELKGDILEVLRNEVPSERSNRFNLCKIALECCRLLSIHNARLLGASEDSESILSAMKEFSQHAEMVLKHNNMDHSQKTKTFAKTVIEVRKMALAASKAVFAAPEMAVMDPHEHYRQVLRPLRFELVSNLQGHAFRNQPPPTSKMNLKNVFRELTAYKTALPIEYGSSIFVRAVENRLDLVRACITGPEDTPYANGIFIFDIYLGDYPKKPPRVKYLCTGGGKYRFNPNLYQDGKVCLSLLGTWEGPGWISGESTLLQVLVSIQSLILVNDPYFNEPGYEGTRGTSRGTSESNKYNKKRRWYTLEVCIIPFLLSLSDASNKNSLYPEFNEVFQQHFRNKKSMLNKQLYKWYSEDQSSLEMFYRQYLDIMEEGQRNNDRKRKAKSLARISSSPLIKTKEVNGIIEIEDEAITSRSQKQTKYNSVNKSENTNIISIDDDCHEMHRKRRATASVATNSSTSRINTTSQSVIDLT